MSETKLSCAEYRDALTEAALAGEPEARLRGHLLECAACSAELGRLSALAGAIDSGVSQMVSAEPSPGFAARVRARVAEESEQSAAAWWRGWVPATVAGVAVLALAAWLLWPAAQNPGNSEAPETAKGAPVAPAPMQPTPSIAAPLSPKPVEHAGGVERAASKLGRAPRELTAARSETPVLPEVLVSGDEWAQVVKLYELTQRGRAALGPPALVDTTPLEAKAQPLLIARLDPIKPIVEDNTVPPPAAERQ